MNSKITFLLTATVRGVDVVTRFYPEDKERRTGKKNMAANIEQIFQDFILNKIKEIEEQKGDET